MRTHVKHGEDIIAGYSMLADALNVHLSLDHHNDHSPLDGPRLLMVCAMCLSGFSGTHSPYCTLLERIASTAHPRTSWVFGFTLNLSL